MAKTRIRYVCQSCGAVFPKWSGRCDACNAWNSIVEEVDGPELSPKKAGRLNLVDLDGPEENITRLNTGIEEFDRAIGGGLVPGSALLLGGDPGIGKSTLTLQICASMAFLGHKVVYISGEESINQVRLRAKRLDKAEADIRLSASGDTDAIVAALDHLDAPDLLVIDSIQTARMGQLEASAGSIGQLRACTQAFVALAKKRSMALILVGHVTKDGQLAGPRVLEHIVDTVLYFEGDQILQYRLLRAVKNRFGPANEIGVFEMREKGLFGVTNPSSIFLGDRFEPVEGTAVFAGVEGTRPLLLEIQALAATSSLATPRRAVIGWDHNRLAMLLAVLEARCTLAASAREVYLNVAGGFRIVEPAADLAVAAAITSSMRNIAWPKETVFFGEVGLAGEIRQVAKADLRVREAQKLGFERVVLPKGTPVSKGVSMQKIELGNLHELIELI